MSNYKNLMRRMRQYTAAVKKNYKRGMTELEKESDIKGTPRYDKIAAEIERKTNDERKRLVIEVTKDLTDILDTMRRNVGERITKAPTAEIVNTLSLLNMLDSLNPTEIRQYAAQMSEYPLAMKVLSVIAQRNNVHINVPDTEAMMSAIDVIESNVANYIQNYTGNNNMSASVKMLHDLYFQPDDGYMNQDIQSSENADTAFWQNIVQIGSPDMLENVDATNKAVDVKYFFTSIDGLLAFIN